MVADPVEMAADLPILSQTMNSGARPVHVESYRPYRGEGRSVWHPVIGRSDPFVSIFPATYPQGELVIRAADNTERTELIRLMQPGDPLLIRSTCPDRLDTFTFLMLGWEDPYTRDDAQGGPSLIRIQYQRVTEVQRRVDTPAGLDLPEGAWTPTPPTRRCWTPTPPIRPSLDGVPG